MCVRANDLMVDDILIFFVFWYVFEKNISHMQILPNLVYQYCFVGYVEVMCFFLWSRIYLITHMSAYYYWVIMSNWVITQMLKTHRGFQDWYMGWVDGFYIHDDVIKWKHFPRYWPFVRGIHRSPVNYQHKGQWRGALMFSLICVWINDWVNNREAGDLRRYRAHYDVIVMCQWVPTVASVTENIFL